MSKVLVLGLSFFSFLASQSVPAKAGPDETTLRLMNEPASLFDLGVLRIQLHLDNIDAIEPVEVYYRSDDDSVVILENSYEYGWSQEQVDQACTDWFFSIRDSAEVSPSSGKPYFGSLSKFAAMFAHYNDEQTISGMISDEVVAEIDKKIFLEYTWFSDSKAIGEISFVTCIGPLLGVGYSMEAVAVEAE